MRDVLALLGFCVAVMGTVIAVALGDASVDDAAGWMLAVAGLALCVVAQWWGGEA